MQTCISTLNVCIHTWVVRIRLMHTTHISHTTHTSHATDAHDFKCRAKNVGLLCGKNRTLLRKNTALLRKLELFCSHHLYVMYQGCAHSFLYARTPDTSLSGNEGLLEGNVGLFCRNTGLFCGNIGLFCGITELFGGNIGLFCGTIGGFGENVWLLCGKIGFFCCGALVREKDCCI